MTLHVKNHLVGDRFQDDFDLSFRTLVLLASAAANHNGCVRRMSRQAPTARRQQRLADRLARCISATCSAIKDRAWQTRSLR